VVLMKSHMNRLDTGSIHIHTHTYTHTHTHTYIHKHMSILSHHTDIYHI